ncbi:MAG: metalloregulator ArsR/SmtB family transcription factor [Candidatus Pacebacteria bacterium]|nr:metalloregulator ArsR/SmtB family transcription factor [Candidatus Paceibacterota bacterium]
MARNIIYKAFANEQRLKLLKCLSESQNVTELQKHCPFSQSALSQHLKVLRDSGLVQTNKQGKQIVYSVTNKEVIKIATLLLNFK